eukprot:395816-Prymnesium_polylepis.1
MCASACARTTGPSQRTVGPCSEAMKEVAHSQRARTARRSWWGDEGSARSSTRLTRETQPGCR